MRQASCSFQAAQSGALGMLQCLLAGGGDQQARGAAACSLCSCIRAGVAAAAAGAGIKASSAPSKRPERDHHIFPQAPPPWPELVVQGHGTDQRATGQTPRSKRMEWDGSVAGHCSEITHSLALFSLKWAAESDAEDHVAVYAVTCCRSYLLTMIKVSRPKFD